MANTHLEDCAYCNEPIPAETGIRVQGEPLDDWYGYDDWFVHEQCLPEYYPSTPPEHQIQKKALK